MTDKKPISGFAMPPLTITNNPNVDEFLKSGTVKSAEQSKNSVELERNEEINNTYSINPTIPPSTLNNNQSSDAIFQKKTNSRVMRGFYFNTTLIDAVAYLAGTNIGLNNSKIVEYATATQVALMIRNRGGEVPSEILKIIEQKIM